MIFGLIAVVVLFIAWCAVGIRLVSLGIRNRSLPELTLGCALLSIAGIGYPLIVVADLVGGLPAALLYTISMLFCDIGTFLLVLFVQRVFRPSLPGSTILLPAFALGGIVHELAYGRAAFALAAASPDGVLHVPALETFIYSSVTAVVFYWAGFESLAYRHKLVLRLRLGLADPVVINRLGLWGGVGLFAGAGATVNACVQLVRPELATGPVIMLLNAFSGIVHSVLLFLAFLPPAAYVAAIQRRAAREPA